MGEIKIGQLRQWSDSGGRDLFIVVSSGPSQESACTWYILGREGSLVKFTSITLMLESEVVSEG